jgi:hypothetical protein
LFEQSFAKIDITCENTANLVKKIDMTFLNTANLIKKIDMTGQNTTNLHQITIDNNILHNSRWIKIVLKATDYLSKWFSSSLSIITHIHGPDSHTNT